jgi:hypothetical protein
LFAKGYEKIVLNLNIYLIRKKIASFAKCLAKVMLKIALDLFYISLNFNFTFNTLRFGKSLEHLQQ